MSTAQYVGWAGPGSTAWHIRDPGHRDRTCCGLVIPIGRGIVTCDTPPTGRVLCEACRTAPRPIDTARRPAATLRDLQAALAAHGGPPTQYAIGVKTEAGDVVLIEAVEVNPARMQVVLIPKTPLVVAPSDYQVPGRADYQADVHVAHDPAGCANSTGPGPTDK